MNLNDFLNDKDLIEQARQAAKAEAEVYRKQQYEELRQTAFEQLKAKFLAEEKAKIDKEIEQTRKEFNWDNVKFEPIEGLPDPEQFNANFESTKEKNIIDEDSKTAKISKNLENRYGINPTEVANEQGRILSDNEEYEDLKEIVDTERTERFLKEVDELEQNFNNPNQTQIVEENFGYGDLASYL